MKINRSGEKGRGGETEERNGLTMELLSAATCPEKRREEERGRKRDERELEEEEGGKGREGRGG